LQHLHDESTHSMFGSEGFSAATHTGLDHLAAAYPFPTYRGSLVIAGGVFRARTNDLASARYDRRPGNTDDFLRTQRDGMYRYTGGVGVDLLHSLSFGISASYWEGQLRDDQYRSISEPSTPAFDGVDRLVTESDVDGFGFDLGLLGYLGRSARLGLAIHSPVWLDIRGDGQLTHEPPGGGSSTTELLFIDQQPRLPWSVVLGASCAVRWILLSAEAQYTAWDEIDFGVPASTSDPLPGSAPDYEATWAARAGAEALIPFTPLRVRAGYAFEPEPYLRLLGNPSRMIVDKSVFTVGGGLLIANAFALDAGASFSRFERADAAFADVTELRETARVYLTGAYRY
jgi:long-subunit fatty acid transport protein